MIESEPHQVDVDLPCYDKGAFEAPYEIFGYDLYSDFFLTLPINSIAKISAAASRHIRSTRSVTPVTMQQHDENAPIECPYARAQQVLELISLTLPSPGSGAQTMMSLFQQ